jgi:hypothetical protein
VPVCGTLGRGQPGEVRRTTLLEEIWAGAPFADKDALVARGATVNSSVSARLLDRAERAEGWP